MRFSDEARLSASAIALSGAAIQGEAGQEADYTPLRQRKPGKPSSRRTDGVCRDPQKFATFSPATRYGTPTTAAASVVKPLHCRVPNLYLLYGDDVAMMKIRSAANAVASGQTAWCRAQRHGPAVMVFAKNRRASALPRPAPRSMTTKGAQRH